MGVVLGWIVLLNITTTLALMLLDGEFLKALLPCFLLILEAYCSLDIFLSSSPKQCVVLDTDYLQKLVLSGLFILGSVRSYREVMFCMGCMNFTRSMALAVCIHTRCIVPNERLLSNSHAGPC